MMLFLENLCGVYTRRPVYSMAEWGGDRGRAFRGRGGRSGRTNPSLGQYRKTLYFEYWEKGHET